MLSKVANIPLLATPIKWFLLLIWQPSHKSPITYGSFRTSPLHYSTHSINSIIPPFSSSITPQQDTTNSISSKYIRPTTTLPSTVTSSHTQWHFHQPWLSLRSMFRDSWYPLSTTSNLHPSTPISESLASFAFPASQAAEHSQYLN